VTLTADQREKIAVEAVREEPFRRTIEAAGTVAFDQTASTQVVSGISGPVARILAPPGTKVAAGAPLAEVTSPDFASALSGYRKTVAASANGGESPTSTRSCSSRGTCREMRRRRPTPGRPKRTAMRFAQLRSIGIPEAAIRGVETGATSQAVLAIRSPIAGTVVERLITPASSCRRGPRLLHDR
jgi:cobalt-zinc-cadmium efflux system membrane fusion protein